MAKKLKIHAQVGSIPYGGYGSSVCGLSIWRDFLTSRDADVTCKNCLRDMGYQLPKEPDASDTA